MKPAKPRGTDSAKVIQVIETRALRGSGTEEDMCRIVFQYWDFDGNLLAENDPCREESETLQAGTKVHLNEKGFLELMEEYMKSHKTLRFT